MVEREEWSIESGRQAVFLGVRHVTELVTICSRRRAGESPITIGAAFDEWRGRRRAWWAEVEAAVDAGVSVPLHAVAERCGLSSREVDILLITLAPLVDPEFLEHASALRRDYFFRGVDTELVVGLLCADAGERFVASALLTPDSPLVQSQLVTLRPVGTEVTPHEVEVRPTDAFANLLLERPLLSGALAEAGTLRPPPSLLGPGGPP